MGINMPNIIYDATRLKVCQGLYEICEYAELDRKWTDKLWQDVLTCREIYDELVYYIEHHTFMDRLKVGNYSLCDLYVFQMNKYNLVREIGKNPRTCNKEKMVMKAFRMMLDMMKSPEEYIKKLEQGKGMDEL